jgi:hypothetical protein
LRRSNLFLNRLDFPGGFAFPNKNLNFCCLLSILDYEEGDNMRFLQKAIVLIVIFVPALSGWIELETGAQYLKWLPDQPKRSKIETTGYTGLTLNARLSYKDLFHLYTLRYEFSNGIEAPSTKGRDALITEKTGTAGYVLFHLLSDFLIPNGWQNMGLILRTDYQDYRADVHFEGDVRYIPYNFEEVPSITYYRSGDEARFYTRFSDFLAGISIGSQPHEIKNSRAYIGLGSSRYQKPYTFRIGDRYLEDTMTDTRFTGTFAAIGLVTSQPIKSGGQLEISLAYHVGSGDMVLVENRVSITDIAENNESSIIYNALEGSASFRRSISKQLFLALESDFKIKSFSLNTPSTKAEDAPAMNQDYFFGLKGKISYQF